MIKKNVTIFCFLCGLSFSSLLFATAFTPNDNDIVASSYSLLKAELSLNEIETLVFNSQFTGETERLQGVLKARLATLYAESPTPKVGYLYARVLQKEHKFNEAIAIANKVLKNAPTHSNTHLLLANMLMIKGEFIKAKQHCSALIGQVSIITISTCVLDLQSQQNGETQLQQSYESLLQITQNKPLTLYTSHVLSEMAYRLKQYKNALEHISSIKLDKAPVSLITLWADIQLGLHNNQQVLKTLGQLINNADNLEDALLLRLAIAEKTTTQKKWQMLIKKRVELRELRQDFFHASDLAKYYLEVEPNQDKAMYWAEINWQQAKMSSDGQLLSQARKLKRDI